MTAKLSPRFSCWNPTLSITTNVKCTIEQRWLLRQPRFGAANTADIFKGTKWWQIVVPNNWTCFGKFRDKPALLIGWLWYTLLAVQAYNLKAPNLARKHTNCTISLQERHPPTPFLHTEHLAQPLSKSIVQIVIKHKIYHSHSIYHKVYFQMWSHAGFDLWWPWEVNDLGWQKHTI